ncbi:hypothetical protein [Streptomyces javensis]|uniref:hypothetical protein n=1 Tax=Streptomyces javensis TaxID=114698 RepID=UPI0031DBA2E2
MPYRPRRQLPQGEILHRRIGQLLLNLLNPIAVFLALKSRYRFFLEQSAQHSPTPASSLISDGRRESAVGLPAPLLVSHDDYHFVADSPASRDARKSSVVTLNHHLSLPVGWFIKATPGARPIMGTPQPFTAIREISK